MESPIKILVLTYYWPPSGGAGVQRWLKMTKHLPDCGVEPVVLTVNPDEVEYPVRDESLSDDVDPRVRVFTTGCFNLYGLYKRFTGRHQAPYGGFANEGTPSFRQKAARFVRGNFLLPDARRSWNRPARKAALRLLDGEHIDTLITTGPPMSTHLIGLWLKRRRTVCWIADFRDPWTDLYYKKMLYQTRWARRIEAAMERRVLAAADHVLTAAGEFKTLLHSKVPHLPEGHFSVLTNGYDPADFSDNVTPAAEFTLTYTGTLSSGYPLGTLIDCMAALSDEVPLHVRLVGQIDTGWAERIRAVCGERCTFVPHLPHREAVREMKRASVLLLVIPDSAVYGALPGKIFEYMGTGAPVLCLGSPQSEAARILAEHGAGECLAGGDAEGISRFLRTQYRAFLEGRNRVDSSSAACFRRDRLAARLSRIVAACRAEVFSR